ncbi:hypothetical protein I551_8298 [Mycobacterium ulcerans str. Harvey]|uniref:Alkyl sulfatase C-terminal domain-containing protein n=1 Tax=Mycobacterium ulcerans str. Harvey TaxID=1299332 RepID=A0ABP3A6Z1_MYCUL|nr:hypothetical protein I551_8298 [Mycobacterium ulcerans str. Harvey]
MLGQLTPEQMFDVLAISVNGPKAWDLSLALDVSFDDLAVNYRLTLRNGVLVYRKASADASTANATIKLAGKLRLVTLAAGDQTSPASRSVATRKPCNPLSVCSTGPNPDFNIVTP